ncbi:MAG TPA: HEAT repeat domain-containing protein [Deltaproteobacteria bacterium]|nr:HEAT repeat domain-containing protein [Deltaproteobacteria bacterium]HPP79287.1 HEAT repeat domain-containing protein [Deltaproteobacteria bacterium]
MDFSEIDALMSSADSSDRRAAANMLGDMCGEGTVERLVRLLKDTNSGVRDAAYNALMFTGGSEAVEKVAPLVAETDPGVRNAAIDILRAIGDDAIDVLHRLARDANDDIRLFMLDILGTIGNPSSVGVLIEGLRDANPNVRNAAVVSLGLLGDPEAFEPLAALIDDEEWIRFSVIEAISHLNHERLPSFIKEQMGRFRNDDLTMCALLEASGASGSRELAHFLVELLEEASMTIECEVVGAILRLLSPEEIAGLHADKARAVKEVIERHVGSVDGDLQLSMFRALEAVGDGRSVQVLLEVARSLDPDARPEVFDAIEETMAAIGDVEAVSSLLEGEEKIVVLGSRVLGRIGGSRASKIVAQCIPASQGPAKRALVDALVEIDVHGNRETFKALLSDRDGHVLRSSITALGLCGGQEDIASLEPFLSHPYPDVREAALGAIVEIDTDQAQQVFTRMMGKDDPESRRMALDGLSRLSSPLIGKYVVECLRDPSNEVRLMAATIVRDREIPLDTEAMRDLLRDPSDAVRCVAIDMVGQRKVEGLRPVLEEWMEGDDMRIASHALDALGAFGDDRAVESLVRVVRKGSDFLRISAVRVLGGLGREDIVGEIEAFVDDPNPDVARAVMDAMDRLRGEGF